MKKLLIAVSLMFGLAINSASQAGGIQIYHDGGGAGPSSFIDVFGNTEGNALFDDAIVSTGGFVGTGGIWRGHNKFDVSSFTGFASELTISFRMPIDITNPGVPCCGIGTIMSMIQTAGSMAIFDIYYDDFGRLDGDIVAGTAANAGTGLGYTDGVLIASGDMSLPGSFTIVQTSAGTVGPLAFNNATPTIESSGGTSVSIDFTDPGGVNLDYVVNDIASAVVDLSAAPNHTTPYDQLPTPQTRASAIVDGVTPFYGDDVTNDFDCANAIASGGTCDFQAQMNTTMFFVGGEVPEPGTLVLLGASLLLLGRRRSLRSKK